MISWQIRYSETELPDKAGRWSRKCFYKDRHIAWVSRVESNGIVKFIISTHFPCNGNDMPHDFSKFDTFDEAKVYVESLWKEFLIFCGKKIF